VSGHLPDAFFTAAGASVPGSCEDAISRYIYQHPASVARYIEAWLRCAVDACELTSINRPERVYELEIKQLLALADMLNIRDDLNKFMRVMMVNPPFVDPDLKMEAEKKWIHLIFTFQNPTP
jgi:hypothetical protein